MTPDISLIVPAYNEERLLPRLLDTVDEAKARFEGRVEVIVSDNGSTDGTRTLAEARGCRVVRVEPRSIAAVRNGGARVAGAPLLAFVDADARIHSGTFGELGRLMGTGWYVGGASGVRLERWSVGLAATYLAMLPWIWLLRFDTGVTFCSREAFLAVGGYRENLRIAEDVAFLLDLRRHGKRTGRRLVRARAVKAMACLRKFDEHGDWHYFRMGGRFLLDALRRRKPGGHQLRYWYEPDR